MTPIVRKMSVVDAPGETDKPMIRLTNNFLVKSGFIQGTAISVSYYPDKIVINKLENQNENINFKAGPIPVCSFSVSASPENVLCH